MSVPFANELADQLGYAAVRAAPSSVGLGGTMNILGGERGICSLYHKGRYLRFRTNPNAIKWNYTLNTRTDQTYGGRVVQLLSVNLGDLRVQCEAGRAGWPYIEKVAKFFRDMLVEQRDGTPGIFEYTARRWKFKVYAAGMPFQDDVGATVRPFDMEFKIQEDVTGVASQSSLSFELRNLRDGIGFRKSDYNQPTGTWTDSESGPVDPNNVIGIIGDVAGAIGNLFNQPTQAPYPSPPSPSGPPPPQPNVPFIPGIPSAPGSAGLSTG